MVKQKQENESQNEMSIDAEIEIIKGFLKTDLERTLFQEAIDQLSISKSPLRVNIFAFVLRELSRLVLERLSPEDQIKHAPWFAEELNDQGKPTITRAQRMKFAIQDSLDDDFVQKNFASITHLRLTLLKNKLGF